MNRQLYGHKHDKETNPEEYKFKPEINLKSENLSKESHRRVGSLHSKKRTEYLEKVDRKIEDKREKLQKEREDKELQLCTFKPTLIRSFSRPKESNKEHRTLMLYESAKKKRENLNGLTGNDKEKIINQGSNSAGLEILPDSELSSPIKTKKEFNRIKKIKETQRNKNLNTKVENKSNVTCVYKKANDNIEDTSNGSKIITQSMIKNFDVNDTEIEIKNVNDLCISEENKANFGKVSETDVFEKIQKIEIVGEMKIIENVEKSESFEKSKNIEIIEKKEIFDDAEKSEHVEKTEKIENVEKIEKIEKIEDIEKIEKIEPEGVRMKESKKLKNSDEINPGDKILSNEVEMSKNSEENNLKSTEFQSQILPSNDFVIMIEKPEIKKVSQLENIIRENNLSEAAAEKLRKLLLL